MYRYHVTTKANNTAYWLKTFCRYGELRVAEWTSKLVLSMHFVDEEQTKEYIAANFENRDDVKADKQYVFAAYDLG